MSNDKKMSKEELEHFLNEFIKFLKFASISVSYNR